MADLLRRLRIREEKGQAVPMNSAEGHAIMAEIERLREIVDQLPKTADGVAVAPGDIVQISDSGTIWRVVRVEAERFYVVYPSAPDFEDGMWSDKWGYTWHSTAKENTDA